MNTPEPQNSLYAPVAEAICQRILIAEDALRQVEADSKSPLAFVSCEVAVLQIRTLCELFLLGSTSAHLLEAGLEISDNKWRPKDAFQQLDKLSEHPLPLPVKVELHKNGEGRHHITPKSRPITFDALSMIYGMCGDLLHVPTTRQVLRGRLPEFDLALLWRWVGGFRELAMAHALMLPDRNIVVLCIWAGDASSQPEVFRLDAAGKSTMDIETYAVFSLLP